MTWFDFLTLMRAAGFSLLIAAAAIPLSTLLAIFLVLIGKSRSTVLRSFYHLYVWVIRGTPLLLLAMLLFYSLASSGLRLNPYFAGILAVSIYHSSFFAEVFRGAVDGISQSLIDSGRSLGLPPLSFLKRVIIPLASRLALPAYINTCVMIVKASSILSVIGVWELAYAGREITERTLEVFSVLSTTAAIYFVICFSVDRLGKRVETALAQRGFLNELKGAEA